MKSSHRIEDILLFVFAIRPIIDLAWEKELILGLNLAGVVALFVIILAIVYFLIKRKFKMTMVSITGIGFVTYMFIVTLFNLDTYSSFDYSLRLFSEIAFLFCVAPEISEKKLRRVIVVFIISSLVPVFITFLQTAGLIRFTYFDYVNGVQISRGSGGYRQPSVLTRFCSIGILYSYYLLDYAKKKGLKCILWIYLGLNITAIVLSYHRTGYLLVIIITLMWFYLKYKNRIKDFLIIVFGAAIALTIGFIVIYRMGIVSVDLSTLKQMLSLSNIVTITSGKVDFVLRGRGGLIGKLFLGFSKNPWYNTVFGNGVNLNIKSGIAMHTADMEWVRVFWNGGVIGGLLWLFHFGTIKNSISVWKRSFELRSLYNLGICMFWLFILWGFTIEATNSPDLMYHIYLICGLFAYKSNLNGEFIRNRFNEHV